MPSNVETSSHRLLWVDTDNRYIISTKSQGFLQTPQDIMEKYNGCSVPQYTAYSLYLSRELLNDPHAHGQFGCISH